MSLLATRQAADARDTRCRSWQMSPAAYVRATDAASIM